MAHSAPYLGLSSHWTALFAFLWSFFSFHLCFSVFLVVFFSILCTLQYIFNVRRAVQHTQHSWFKRVAQEILSGILLQQPRR